MLPVVLSGAGVKVASSAFTCDWRERKMRKDRRRSGIVVSGTMVSFILDVVPVIRNE